MQCRISSTFFFFFTVRYSHGELFSFQIFPQCIVKTIKKHVFVCSYFSSSTFLVQQLQKRDLKLVPLFRWMMCLSSDPNGAVVGVSTRPLWKRQVSTYALRMLHSISRRRETNLWTWCVHMQKRSCCCAHSQERRGLYSTPARTVGAEARNKNLLLH